MNDEINSVQGADNSVVVANVPAADFKVGIAHKLFRRSVAEPEGVQNANPVSRAQQPTDDERSHVSGATRNKYAFLWFE
jgi:hypothetical protein